MKLSTTQIGAMADTYALLIAQQAELAKKVKEHKAAMLATGRIEFDGAAARVTISKQTGRTGNDMAAIKLHYEKMGVPLPTKALADATRFNVNAKLTDTSVAA